jgi:hypothetical protein
MADVGAMVEGKKGKIVTIKKRPRARFRGVCMRNSWKEDKGLARGSEGGSCTPTIPS